VQPFETAHRPQSGFQAAMIFDRIRPQHIVSLLLGYVIAARLVGAEPVIHGGDLHHCLTVVVGHDRRLWLYDCSI
jgi:hypothetical protein